MECNTCCASQLEANKAPAWSLDELVTRWLNRFRIEGAEHMSRIK